MKLPTLTIQVFRDQSLVQTEVLSQSVIKIGKLSSSHLRLEDDSVSRMHAVIEVSRDGIHIVDLGSSAGTIVNGKRVSKATLQSGDSLQVGALRLQLQVATGEATSAAEQAPLAPPLPSIPAPPPTPAIAVAPAAPVPTSFANQGEPMYCAPETQAVEVRALLGDSVVAVKHLVHPSSPATRKTTRAFLLAGASLLVLSAVGFGKGVSVASDNKAKHAEHMASGKVAHEFRPERLSFAFDWMALGGLFGGMAFLGAGLLRRRDEDNADALRIGSASGVDFPSADTQVADFSLVQSEGDGFRFNIDPSWQGRVHSAAGQMDLHQWMSQQPSKVDNGLAHSCLLPSGTEVEVQAGSQQFCLRPMARARKQSVPFLSGFDSQFAAYIGAAAVCILGFVFILDTLAPDPRSTYSDLFADTGRLVQVQTRPNEDSIEEPKPAEKGDTADVGGQGTKMAGAEGEMGTKESTATEGQFSMKDNHMPPAVARQLHRNRARTAGILGAMAANPMSFQAEFATADMSSGLDDRDIYGGMVGDEVGEKAGGWGFGIHGIAQGGGGDDWGTVGTGEFGLVGHNDGTGDGYKAGDGKEAGMRGHHAQGPEVDIGPVRSNGGLDAKIIRRHVRRKLNRIRHCYERELVVNEGLEGTVTVRFQISPQGLVQGLNSGGMGNTNVESCVAEAIQAIHFPQPDGGNYVNVKAYPFTFRPAGG